MKKIEITVLLILTSITPLFAAHKGGPAGMIAAALGALFFYGILSLVRGVKQRKKNVDKLEDDSVSKQKTKILQKSVPWTCTTCSHINTINVTSCEKCGKE